MNQETRIKAAETQAASAELEPSEMVEMRQHPPLGTGNAQFGRSSVECAAKREGGFTNIQGQLFHNLPL